MAILQALLTALGHAAGKIANLAFAWATTMLFGRVPDDRQIYLSIICLLAVVWLITAIGTVFPAVGAFLLTFVTFPWLSKGLLRMVMLAAGILLPAVVGVIALFLLEPQKRPHKVKNILLTLLKGYPLTIGLALTLVMLVVVAPCVKVADMVKRWQSAHIPVQILPDDYTAVVDRAKKSLDDRHIRYQATQSSAAIRIPLKVLMTLSGKAFQSFVSDNLTTFRLANGEIAVYPADIIVRAPERDSGRIQAQLVQDLAFSRANFTWTKDAQHFEDLLKSVRKQYLSRQKSAQDVEFDLAGISKALDESNLDFAEWQTVFREKLMLEREILRNQSGKLWFRRTA